MKNGMNKLMVAALSGSLLIGAAACSSDSDSGLKPATLLSFEESTLALAGPTAKGENLYSNYTPTADFPAFTTENNHEAVSYGINKGTDGVIDFSHGGIARSHYTKFRELNGDALLDESWYNEESQLCVYNRTKENRAGAKSGDYFLVASAPNAQIHFKEPQKVLSLFAASTSRVVGLAYKQCVETEKPVRGTVHVRGYYGDVAVADGSIELFTIYDKIDKDEVQGLEGWKRIELQYSNPSIQEVDRLEINISFTRNEKDPSYVIPPMVCIDHIQFKTK